MIRIKVDTKNIPKVGQYVVCHSSLAIDYPNNDEICVIPLKRYEILHVFLDSSEFMIKNEQGYDHYFEFTNYMEWFNEEFEN